MRIAWTTLALVSGLSSGLVVQDSTPAAAQSAGPAAAETAAKQGPAASVGLHVFPAKSQTPEQQKKDEQECYTWAKEQSGIDPAAVKANPDSAAKAAAARTDSAAKGAAVKGAAKGAVGGAVVGGIVGDAGAGAGVGAVAGAAKGRQAKKQAGKAAEQQAVEQTNAAAGQQMDSFKKAMTACVEGKGYTVK